MKKMAKKDSRPLVVGGLALLFGAATLLEGVRTLALEPALRPEGVVTWVLGFNVVAGFFYLAAGAGILLKREWAEALAWALAGCTALVFLGLLLRIAQGGAYMPRTVGAMTLRSGFWFTVALLLGRWRRTA